MISAAIRDLTVADLAEVEADNLVRLPLEKGGQERERGRARLVLVRVGATKDPAACLHSEYRVRRARYSATATLPATGERRDESEPPSVAMQVRRSGTGVQRGNGAEGQGDTCAGGWRGPRLQRGRGMHGAMRA